MTLLPGPQASYLTRARREESLRRLAEERYDVVVVGGGVTGAGVALDAVSRGLRTALVERADLATGTSRWSSKLVHGGVRYLASGQVGVAWESARERHALITTVAPHLVQPVAFLVPLDGATGPAMGRVCEAGARAADLMRRAARTPTHLLPAPTRISAQDALVHAPCLDPDGLRGGLLSWDGRLEDDARLVVALARTAAALGADVVTGVAASDLGPDRLTAHRHRRPARRSRRAAPSSTPPGCGPASTSRRCGWCRAAARTWCCGPGRWAGPARCSPSPSRATWAGSCSPCRSRTAWCCSVSPTSPPAATTRPPRRSRTTTRRSCSRTVNRALATRLGPDDVVGRFAGLRPLVRGLPRPRPGRHGHRGPLPAAPAARRAGPADHHHRRQAHDLPPDGRGRRRRRLPSARPRRAEPHPDPAPGRCGPPRGARPGGRARAARAPLRDRGAGGARAGPARARAGPRPWRPGAPPPAPSCCSAPSPRAPRRWRTCSSGARGSRWSTPTPPPRDRWPSAPWRSRRPGTGGRGWWPRRPDPTATARDPPARGGRDRRRPPLPWWTSTGEGTHHMHDRRTPARALVVLAAAAGLAACGADPDPVGDGATPVVQESTVAAPAATTPPPPPEEPARAGARARARCPTAASCPPCRAPTAGSTRSTSCPAT